MLQPVKIALGEFMGRFYQSLVATTKPMGGYLTRGLGTSIVWAPTRMIDMAEEMLSLWMRSDLDDAPTTPPELPVMIVAMAKDYTPTGREYTRQVADPILVMIPEDEKARAFGVRCVAGDVRVQLAIFAHDEPTARSLAAQFLLFLDATPNRRFMARYTFAGLVTEWPVQVESPDAPAIAIQTDAKNLTILAIDITLHAEIPLFDAPAEGQPNDGKGVPGTDDPAGYPLVTEVATTSMESGDSGGECLIRAYQYPPEIPVDPGETVVSLIGSECTLGLAFAEGDAVDDAGIVDTFVLEPAVALTRWYGGETYAPQFNVTVTHVTDTSVTVEFSGYTEYVFGLDTWICFQLIAPVATVDSSAGFGASVLNGIAYIDVSNYRVISQSFSITLTI